MHTDILCASLVRYFVWSLWDVQQSPFLFCFSQFALCRLEMGNRSKAEWMSCFARSPVLNGFQGWVSLCMCCLAGSLYVCVCMIESERERANFSMCTCVLCMYMQIYVCLSASVPVCLKVFLCVSVLITESSGPLNTYQDLPCNVAAV